MSSGEKVWPQEYGFRIVGNGPTFILSVDPGSEAQESGLVTGDRLMELDGYDVSRLSSDVLTILMKETNGRPPAVGVVPGIRLLYLSCKKSQRCGFSVTTKEPITVSNLEPTGLAFAAGLRKGDILLTANHKPISEFGRKDLVLNAENESLVLSIIPNGIRENTITDDFRGPQIKTSKFLFTKVAKCCGKDYHKKMTLTRVLTDYSEDWDVHTLCTYLDNLLKEPSDRKLLKHIEPFIPRHQKDIFKPLLKRKKLYKDCQHLAYIPNKPAQKLNFQILRGNNPYGFVIKGSSPVHVEWLDSAGPADLAGLVPGDFITAVNEIDTSSFSHEQMIKLLQFCGPTPIIEVERYADVISEVGINSSFDTLSSISSTFGVEQLDWIYDQFSNGTDSGGMTFKQKMEYLLTPRERAELQMNYLQYVNSSNIVRLYQKLEPILDSPSRRSLWRFLLTKMSESHQEYIHLKENLSETLQGKSTKNLLEYYLNCREETKLKDALDLYLKIRSFEQVRIMERILNTPAKEELWKSIFPHVIPEHLQIIQKQREKQRKIFENRGIGRKSTSSIYLPPRSESNLEEYDSEEEFKLLEAAVQSVHISNDLRPSNLPPDDGSINGRSTLSEAPGFHGNSISACSFSSHSKTPKIVSPHDFTESRSLQRKRDETQTHDQVPNNKSMPQKPKRKTGMTSNRTPDYKLSSEYVQSDYGSNPSVYRQSGQQIRSRPVQTRREARDPQNDPEELSFPVNELREDRTVDVTLECYDDGSKDRRIPVPNKINLDPRMALQNEKQNQSKTDKNPPHLNPKNHYPEFTTFGKVLSQSNLTSSRDRITPVLPEDKMEDPNKFDYAGIKFSDTQGPSEITHNAPVPIYRSTENGNHATAIPLIEDNDRDSFGVHEQFNCSTPMRTEKTKNTNGTTSAVHPYQNDVGQSIQPPGVSYSSNDHVSVMEKIKELEAHNNIPKPPPAPPVPPLPNDRNDVPENKSVKKLHWEKITQNPGQDTIWAKSPNEDMQDILPHLMLDTNFGSKKTKAQQTTGKKKEVAILVTKKAYNLCILLAHLKLSVSDIKKAILEVDESVLTFELLQQLLTYAPNEAEIREYENFTGNIKDLDKADQFSYEMIQIPNYKDRIQALVFKANFTERTEVLKTIIANLKSASLELQKSESLANILQLILVMGNYLNRGNERISGAAGFRISFLTQIDNTKTTDNKTTFLHVLADAVMKKFPNSPSLNKELSSVLKVAKVSSTDVKNEIEEMTSSQKNITNIIGGIKNCDSSDKIQEIMTNFLDHTEETIQSLLDSLDEALKEFKTTLHYFGEEDKNTNTQKIFDIFATFIEKFEKSRRDISMNLNP